jgi:tetratricopeptide (TPR) repeat protein
MKLISNSFLKKMVLSSLGIILSLAFLEVFVRVFFHQNITPSLLAPGFGLQSVMRPNFKSEALNSVGVRYKIQTNNNRLRRSGPTQYKKQPNTFRILCIGDSMTFGISISNNETYPYYLEEILNKNIEGIKFEVLNTGVTGWGPIDYLLYLKNEGIKYSPDLVIIGMDASDIVSLKPSSFEFERFKVSRSPDAVNISLINPNIKPYFDQAIDTIRERIVNLPFFLQISETSHFLNLIRKNLSIDFTQTKKPTDSLTSLISDEGIDSKDVVNWKIAIDSENLEFNQSRLSELQNILFTIIQNEIEKLSKEKNFKLALVKVPYGPEVFGTIDPQNDMKKFLLSSSKIINFSKEFKAFSGKNPIPLYFPYDIHFTPSGNRLFAYLLLNYLVESKNINGKQLNIHTPTIIQEIETANGKIKEKIKQLPVWNLILAKKYKSLHQLKQAEETLQLFLKQEPNSGEGLFQMGLIYYDLKQWDQALKYLNRAFKFNKLWGPEILNYQAKAYYRKGDLSNAEKLWYQAINLTPNNSKLYRNLGSLYFGNKHYKQAVEQYNISLQLNPNEYKVYLVSGLAYVKLQKREKAITMFQNVLRLQPDNLIAQGALKQLSSIQ